MKLKGAQIFIRSLIAEDVDTIFGYPGGAVLDIYDEIFKERLRHILVRHEQGGVHAADGYARATGRVGVCLVTSGPGATNTVTGIATAYMDSIPMVVFTGQVATPYIGTDAFQEADITGITRPCTKHNFLVRRVEDLEQTVHEAFHIARSGRPGPVLVDLPKDVMQAETDYPALSPSTFRDEETALHLDQDAIQRAYGMIKKSKRPVIMAGGGVIGAKAAEELRSFAESARIPVTATLMGIGGFPGTSPLWLGMPGMHGTYQANMAVSHCDLLVVAGARFSDRVTGKTATFAPKAKIIQIDIDAASIDKVVRTELPVVGDAKQALAFLNTLLANNHFYLPEEERKAWLGEIAQWKTEARRPLRRNGTIKPQEVIRTLSDLTGGDAIIATEVGQNQMWTAQHYCFTRPNTFLSSGGLGTMGYGFPAAIGAQVAFPERTVIDIAGDGSIQMNIQELATAVNYRLPVKVIILNNGHLGMVRQWQELFYGKRYSHTVLTKSPDFVKLAESYGAVGLRADKPEEVEPVLTQGLSLRETVVMDFTVDQEESVYPMVNPGASITEMRLY
ncbi:MAG: biosynthetic-type acetolactate synthase large subunit [Deltaproteobacteria bacterium]|nr:biosynthetic-type acetolactate synthase large subunit [Deltaproteobacteria bacterium]